MRRDSFDQNRSRSTSKNSLRRDRNFIDEADEDEYDLSDRRGHYHRREESIDSVDVEAWPRGIIKTVSVEVIEEVNPDHVPGNYNGGVGNYAGGVNNGNMVGFPMRSVSRGGDHSNRVSGSSVMEQDWETMLRNGPPGK